MNVIRVRSRIVVATGVAVVAVVSAAGTAWACGVRPGGDGRGRAGPELPGAVVPAVGRVGNGWLPGPCGPRPTGALPTGPATSAAAPSDLPGCDRRTGAPSPRPAATRPATRPATAARPATRPATAARPATRPATAARPATRPATGATRAGPPPASGPVLWGPYTMTLSSVPPMVNPWQTGELTAPSTGLVTSVRCTARGSSTVRVSLYNAALTKVAVGPPISCDGRTSTGGFDVNRGGTYYLSFSATGSGVRVTATVSAR